MVGLCYPPGFLGVNAGSPKNTPAPSLSHLGKPITHVGLLLHYDGSTAHSLALPMTTCSQRLASWVLVVADFLPASEIEGQSLLRGRRISLFTATVENYAPHRTSSCQRKGYLRCPPSLSVVAHFGRTNRTFGMYTLRVGFTRQGW